MVRHGDVAMALVDVALGPSSSNETGNGPKRAIMMHVAGKHVSSDEKACCTLQ